MANHSMSATAALQLVQGELDILLNQLGGNLDLFSKNWSERTGLNEAINDLLVLRGTLDVIEMPAPKHFAEEALEILKEMPFAATEADQQKISQISYGCALVARYFDYIVSKQSDLPELLIPAINQLRQSRRLAPLLDSHFYPVRVPRVRIASSVSFAELNQTGRRQHLLFQMGLLHVVRLGKKGSGLKLCARATEVLGKTAADGRHKEFWYLATGVINSLAGDLMLTATRLRWLSQIERYIGKHLEEARHDEVSVIPDVLWRDVFYHLSLSRSRPAGFDALAKAFQVPVRPMDDHELLDAQKALGAPADETYRIVLGHVHDELEQLLSELNHKVVASPGAELDQTALETQIHRLGQTLAVIEQASLASELIASAATLSRHEGNVLVACHSTVQIVINALNRVRVGLDAKLATSKIESELEGIDPNDVKIDERHAHALADIRSYLQEIKSAFDGYLASEGNRSHIKQVNGTVEKICQALTFMKYEELAEPLLEIQHVVDHALDPANLRSLPAKTLTMVADLLMAVDYAIECLILRQPIPDRVYTLAQGTVRVLRKSHRVA